MKEWFGWLTLNKALVILAIAAAVLGTIAYVVVFYGGGTYIVSSPLPTGIGTAATTTATSTLGTPSSTASSSGVLAQYSSSYAVPPIRWMEGYDTLSITAASLVGSQLTLTLSVWMGAVPECVPMNLRLVTDEQGDLAAPLNAQFSFPDTSSCEGTPGANYTGQNVTFNVDPSSMPLSFTTGGTSNEYFEVATTASGTIDITPPPTNG